MSNAVAEIDFSDVAELDDPGIVHANRNKKKRKAKKSDAINWPQAEKLAMIHCTSDEIGGFFDMSGTSFCDAIKTKYNETFTEWAERFRAHTRMAIRKQQLQLALNGNVKMLIHLGKQYCGQAEKVETDNTHRAEEPQVWEIGGRRIVFGVN